MKYLKMTCWLLSFFVLSSLMSYSSLAAAQHSSKILILPWPKNDSEKSILDFAEGINLSLQYSPSRMALSLWGWERFEKKYSKLDLDQEMGGVKYSIDQGFDKGQYYGITVIDTVKRVLPHDIDAKINWNSPELLERYKRVLIAFSEELESPPDYFVIANEADVYFEKNPKELDDFIKFFINSKKMVKAIFPTTKVGVTTTFEGLQKGGLREEQIRKIVEISDAMFMTYYPVFDLKAAPPETTPKHLDDMIKFANGKNVILQEVGYPSGLNGVSEAQQAKFFEIILPAIQDRPQIEFASIFALHDFDEKTCSTMMSYYGFSGFLRLSPWIEDFQKMLCSLGLRRSDGTSKPAWYSVIKTLQK
jgi:hypothetical protein